MRVLAKVDEVSDKYILIYLADKKAGRKVNGLIGSGRYLQAIKEVLSQGDLLREVSETQKHRQDADLILTERSAHWDLTV